MEPFMELSGLERFLPSTERRFFVGENVTSCPRPRDESSWTHAQRSNAAHLNGYATPRRLGNGWTVKIETHFLGGMRHFRRWEIADIGILLFIRDPLRVATRKVALLQSKRLYPTTMTVREETTVDYEIGFARLADPSDLARSIAYESQFTFNASCRYGELVAG